MNKYQEALNKLKELGLSIPANGQGEEFGFSNGFDFDHDGYELECSLMQELVDKETPMKPIKETNNEDYFINCPKCGDPVYVDDWNAYLHRCEWCGQKIDWSEDEE